MLLPQLACPEQTLDLLLGNEQSPPHPFQIRPRRPQLLCFRRQPMSQPTQIVTACRSRTPLAPPPLICKLRCSFAATLLVVLVLVLLLRGVRLSLASPFNSLQLLS